MAYPEKINQRLENLRHARSAPGNAVGTEANFSCGSFIRFSILIDDKQGSIVDAYFSSNGCGFMLAAADVLAESVKGKRLGDLHGLSDPILRMQISLALGEVPDDRSTCIQAVIDALRAAFVDHRSRLVEEFRGERALICTCFSVSEEMIEAKIAERSLKTVDEVGDACAAGSGCGSCRMLIQEILDRASSEFGISEFKL